MSNPPSGGSNSGTWTPLLVAFVTGAFAFLSAVCVAGISIYKDNPHLIATPAPSAIVVVATPTQGPTPELFPTQNTSPNQTTITYAIQQVFDDPRVGAITTLSSKNTIVGTLPLADGSHYATVYNANPGYYPYTLQISYYVYNDVTNGYIFYRNETVNGFMTLRQGLVMTIHFYSEDETPDVEFN